jgi:hypothetical protein
MLKRQTPNRTFAEWDDAANPGFCEVDLVPDDGGSGVGEFCQTLDLTCVATGWTEPRALRNKAQRWVHEAIDEISGELPFPLVRARRDREARRRAAPSAHGGEAQRRRASARKFSTILGPCGVRMLSG